MISEILSQVGITSTLLHFAFACAAAFLHVWLHFCLISQVLTTPCATQTKPVHQKTSWCDPPLLCTALPKCVKSSMILMYQLHEQTAISSTPTENFAPPLPQFCMPQQKAPVPQTLIKSEITKSQNLDHANDLFTFSWLDGLRAGHLTMCHVNVLVSLTHQVHKHLP